MKETLYKIQFILILTGITLCGFSQDVHFSQYQFSPLSLNPANTGNFYGSFRVSNIFRSQWKKFANEGYQTFGIAYDRQFENLCKNLSLGGILIYDKAGYVNLTVSKFLFSASYKKVFGRNILIAGLQGGMIFKQLNNATYSTQFDWSTGGINPALPSLEDGLNENIAFPDINAGILWKRKFGRFEPELGASFFHINHPRERFTEQAERLQVRSMYSIKTRIVAGDKLYIEPNAYYQRTSKADNLLAGCQLRYDLPKNSGRYHYILLASSIRSGFGRQTDAVVISAGIAKSDFLISIAYDINISEIKEYTQSSGAFEIGIIYTGLSNVINNYSLPCTRE